MRTTLIQQPTEAAKTLVATPLNPLALAVGFGFAAMVLILLFGTVMGSMWGMMGGTGAGGWMMGGGHGYGGSSMMGAGIGFLLYALAWGFFGGAVAGVTAAFAYNAVIRRNA